MPHGCGKVRFSTGGRRPVLFQEGKISTAVEKLVENTPGETLVEPENSRFFYTTDSRKGRFVAMPGGERFGFWR
jgi:hypothetical protein